MTFGQGFYNSRKVRIDWSREQKSILASTCLQLSLKKSELEIRGEDYITKDLEIDTCIFHPARPGAQEI